ncbi:MAG: transglutaminase [Myxococcaceae bacterium]|nr:transglutaminase [Myxococcaceae bacterium]
MQKPSLSHAKKLLLTAALLLATVGGMVLYKVQALGYSLRDTLPLTSYHVTYALDFDGHGEDVRVRTFLPATDAHQQISQEENQATGLHFNQRLEGLNRVATWAGADVPDGTRLRYSFTVLPSRLQFQLPAQLPVPESYPASVSPFLRPEKEIQVDAPELTATLARIGGDRGSVQERLRRIYALTSELKPRPFKGTTDALTALRLGEASCNGKSRLFVGLARAAGIPARLVGGLILEPGAKKTSHQWVEAYVAGHWVPFCPTNGHFAELPERYLTLYYGDEALFRHSSDINFNYRFEVASQLVPSPKAKASFKIFNVWALFERMGLSFSLLRTLLMLPVGALIVVLFRNVIGLPTFGTFLPALIAAGAGETGALWGFVGVLLVVVVVSLVRWGIQRLELLHSPTLAILLTVVTLALLGTSLLAERFGLMALAHVTFFPIAVLAITAERFYLSFTEQGTKTAMKELGGTLLVMLACFLVMNSLALQVLLIGFPEILLLVVAANIYLGRWVGVRLMEYRRFRRLLFQGSPQ